MNPALDRTIKSLTCIGIFDDGYNPARTVERIVDDNTFVVEMYTPGPDGKDFMTMEITYNRIK